METDKENCVFCKIIAGEIPSNRIYEDEHFVAFVDIKPVNLGHTLVVPKNHATDLFSLSAEDLGLIGVFTQKVAAAVKAGTKADGINLGMNNGEAAGQLVPHAHIHVIPRFIDDGLKHWPSQDWTQEKLNETAEKIRASI